MVTRFMKMFLPVLVLILACAGVIGHLLKKDRTENIATPETIRVQKASEYIGLELSRPVTHLHSLAEVESGTRLVLDGQRQTDTTPLAYAFISLLSRNPEYAQMRWIGDNGMERVRVYRTGDGKVHIASSNELQDKSDRYYVVGTLKLKPREIYVSPLDLNIEHGQIEIPHRPMIRLGTRVFRSDGTPNGLFVLNISARTMLDKFSQYGQGGDLALLNSDGYWLKGRRAEDEWGFMFNNRNTFGRHYPEDWKRISSTDTGQLETRIGLWTWKTVRVTTKSATSTSPVTWIVVSHIPETALAKAGRNALLPVLLNAGVLLIAFGIGFWKFARESELRLLAEKALKLEHASLVEANRQLAVEVEERESIQTELTKSYAELQLNSGRLQLAANVYNNISEGVMITDPTGNIVSVNPAFHSMTGYLAEELVGKNPRTLKSGKHTTDFYQSLWQSVEREGYWRGEIWNRRKNGSLFLTRQTITAIRDNHGELQHYVSVQSDITESKRAEESIRHKAYHDALTGLPNRALLLEQTELHLAFAKRHNKMLAILFVDLDGFKAINDEFGHDVGDLVLKASAARLKTCARESDTVARIGGDEFVAVLNDLAASTGAAEVARKMIDCLEQPLPLPDGHANRISASIGIAIYPTIGEKAEALMAAADEAMYVAKRNGKATYVYAALPEIDGMGFSGHDIQARAESRPLESPNNGVA